MLMRKAQELSLNLVVVGALALLVLVLIGGVMVFGGGDLIEGLTSIGASDEEVRVTSFTSTCQSKCNILNNLLDSDDLSGSGTGSFSDQTVETQVKAFCCESNDLDGDGSIEESGDLGSEYCAEFYDCSVDGVTAETFCYKWTATGYIDCS